MSTEEDGILYLSDDEAREMFDQIARTKMGISGAEFVKQWRAGVYEGVNWDDVEGLVSVAMALPFVGEF